MSGSKTFDPNRLVEAYLAVDEDGAQCWTFFEDGIERSIEECRGVTRLYFIPDDNGDYVHCYSASALTKEFKIPKSQVAALEPDFFTTNPINPEYAPARYFRADRFLDSVA